MAVSTLCPSCQQGHLHLFPWRTSGVDSFIVIASPGKFSPWEPCSHNSWPVNLVHHTSCSDIRSFTHSLPDHIPRSESGHVQLTGLGTSIFVNISLSEGAFHTGELSNLSSWLHTLDGKQSTAVPYISTSPDDTQAVLAVCSERRGNWWFTCLTYQVQRRDLSRKSLPRSEDPEAKEVRRRRMVQAIWFRISLGATDYPFFHNIKMMSAHNIEETLCFSNRQVTSWN